MSATSAALPSAHQAAHHGLLADLVLAGVAFDLQATPAIWRGISRPGVPVMVPEPVVPVAVPAPGPAPVVIEPANAWRVWQAGEAGGVVVVLSAPGPLGEAETQLLHNMLRAVGLPATPVAYVGLAGTPSKAQTSAVQAALTAAVAAAAPTHTLVLGQTVLGVLLGKLQGVEGWQAAPTSLSVPGQVGVTFPLDLLLHKPLFKGLAWQHLQAWQQTWQAGRAV